MSTLSYNLNDPEHSEFVGMCIPPRGPNFALLYGRHEWPVWEHDVEIDGEHRHLKVPGIFQDGPELDLSRPDVVAAMAAARDKITVSVGRWRRTVPANPIIGRFVKDCRASIDKMKRATGGTP